MDAQYTSVAQTVRDGESANVAMSNKRVLLTAQADASTGAPVSLTDPVQVYAADSYANIVSATTTVVKGSAGTLTRIEVNNAGTANVLTIYDNTAASGTKIGTTTILTDRTKNYGCTFGTGLTIVTSATCDITVIYR